jgi:hypothetical protein
LRAIGKRVVGSRGGELEGSMVEVDVSIMVMKRMSTSENVKFVG